MQVGRQCFCGNKYGKYGKSKNCRYACPGNRGEKTKCGGPWANSVWRTAHQSTAAKKVVIRKAAATVAAATHNLARIVAVAKKPTGIAVRAIARVIKLPVTPRHVAPKVRNAGARFVFKGCFQDHANRDLPKYMGSFAHNDSSFCGHKCENQGYTVFGMQVGGQCFCGHKFGKYGKSTNCKSICPGNRRHKCGGGWANSVFAIERPALPKKSAPKKVVVHKKAAAHKALPKLKVTKKVAASVKKAVKTAQKSAKTDC